jgi:hypothetical protein
MSSRKPYPSDVSDEEWALVAPYLPLLPEEARHREHPLREAFNTVPYLVRYGVASHNGGAGHRAAWGVAGGQRCRSGVADGHEVLAVVTAVGRANHTGEEPECFRSTLIEKHTLVHVGRQKLGLGGQGLGSVASPPAPGSAAAPLRGCARYRKRCGSRLGRAGSAAGS